MMKGLVVEESMSNLTTCASGEVISVSSGSRIEVAGNMYTHQRSLSSTNHSPPPPPKKRRNLPGNPDPNAEVIALSPKSLLATNRFLCEICNKGFQRDQNLQLHRRGHNLPWKLKQRTSKEERKKVYVCPESTCVHHDPSRALGDLTGIKKHFSRKHCEKKWKCEKCSKKYAVQSDWKAHSKICGTREYRCDCAKVFSRRDSFITHRAFCDVLAEEGARAMTGKSNPLLFTQQQFDSSATHMSRLPSQLQISHGGLQALSSVKMEQNPHHLFNPRPHVNNIPPWLASGLSSPLLFSGSSVNPSPNPNSSTSLLLPSINSSHMSATALLQKAAQMGVTMSKPSTLPHQAAHMSENNNTTAAGLICSTEAASTAGSAGLVLASRDQELASGFGHALASFGNNIKATTTVTSGFMDQQFTSGSGLHDMMTTCFSPGTTGFDKSSSSLTYEANLNPKKYSDFQTRTTGSQISKNDHEYRTSNKLGGSDGLTRDFLGLKAFPDQRDFINIAGLDYMNPPPSSSTYAERNQNQRP
ncbi:hypothetical protein EZV62_012577 [Acer yangbiense]|uniref:C2H2-type domain-containing protein n=1 Tax=Acer yangbiense TaxID=1000413 RepID=A0A5C7HWN2_9ROSI|nr:hypothetical protein EZV62_012577 [Acer yangbiense]